MNRLHPWGLLHKIKLRPRCDADATAVDTLLTLEIMQHLFLDVDVLTSAPAPSADQWVSADV
ncbi:hypothetical protein BC938DRAFT_479864 [Jimgerdemannia flammicorona]|uniref:Uncharacterized protein n=1 Tax=Jimgerdemannia flammicorona TaxID=994334 RepID=A0A433QXJ5_9FUNG|nr:hypothetical protein BC938DRAFT_479864 [Jimgerdemannia flammicorona]